MQKEIRDRIVESYRNKQGSTNTTESIVNWIKHINEITEVNIHETQLSDDSFWYYDAEKGTIHNKKNSFFSICGIKKYSDDKFIEEQPIIVQNEIGYLGILCKIVDGEFQLLMQAKIEPGNINCVQISPTIQATKSNFMRAHGGKTPNYLEHFESVKPENILFDQVQSEQGSRFLKKRNRNIIIFTTEEVEVKPNFKWMTIGQLQELMLIDNLVNMDTRTVVSGFTAIVKSEFTEKTEREYVNTYKLINDIKMYEKQRTEIVPLGELKSWKTDKTGIDAIEGADFNVKYYDIQIESREVEKWSQPLFKASAIYTFGLMSRVRGSEKEFLVKLRDEIGSFDVVELGPTIQRSERSRNSRTEDAIEKLFNERLEKKQGIMRDVMLSEEGGRFYHEQNRNVIMDVSDCDIESCTDKAEGYIWLGHSTLAMMLNHNNILNIQLRNLLAMLDEEGK